MLVELEVAQVSMDPFLNAPVLVLRDPASGRRIVSRIGQGEALSLVSVIEKIPLGCPTTHDFALSVVEALGGQVVRVELEPGHERGACAVIVVRPPDGNGELRLEARVVDAVALALRAAAPIHADDSLLEVALEVDCDGCSPCPEWGGPAEMLETLPDEEFPKYKM
jgi:bifunctional DNase/RNase